MAVLLSRETGDTEQSDLIADGRGEGKKPGGDGAISGQLCSESFM